MTTKDPKAPTIGFHDRYNSDQEFRKQIDEARKRSAQERSTRDLQKALDMVKNKKKHY